MIIWKELRNHRLAVTGLIALMLVSAAVGLVSPLLMKELIDVAIPTADGARIGWVLAAMVAVPILSYGASGANRYLTFRLGFLLARPLEHAVFDHYINVKIEDIEKVAPETISPGNGVDPSAGIPAISIHRSLGWQDTSGTLDKTS